MLAGVGAPTIAATLSLHDALPISPAMWTESTRDIWPAPMPTVAEGPASTMAVDLTCLQAADRKSTRLNSSHSQTSYAVFCLKKKSTLAVRLDRHMQSAMAIASWFS